MRIRRPESVSDPILDLFPRLRERIRELTAEVRCPPINTDPIGPTEVGIRSNHLTHSLLVATVLLADGMECGWSEDLVAFGKQR